MRVFLLLSIFFVAVPSALSADVEANGFPEKSSKAFSQLKFTALKEPKLLGNSSFVYESRLKKISLNKETYYQQKPGDPDPMAGAEVKQSVQIKLSFKAVAEISEGPWKGAQVVVISEDGQSLLEEDSWSDPAYSATHTALLFSNELAKKLPESSIANLNESGFAIALLGYGRPNFSEYDRYTIVQRGLTGLGYGTIHAHFLPDELRFHPLLMSAPDRFEIGESAFVISDEASFGGTKETSLKHPYFGQAKRSEYFNVYSFTTPFGQVLNYNFEPPPALLSQIEELETTKAKYSCAGAPGKRESDPFLKSLDFVDGAESDFQAFSKDGKYKLVTGKIGSKDFESEYANYSQNADSFFAYEHRDQDIPNKFGNKILPAFLAKKLSKEEFLAFNPAVYWKAPFGSYLKCTNVLIGAPYMAEPVLYLYPPAKMSVDIQLSKLVDIEVSKPTAIDNFWRVSAEPSGTLRVDGDDRRHKYIFWEGRSFYFPEPSSWFQVSKEGLGDFFRKTLPKLGLNESETKDFVSFWVPRMTSSPYYEIFFHTDYMNAVAAYDIRPMPDSLIRVMMDFRPSDGVKDSQEPELGPVPERKGFVAVEWGGLLR
jgi:hypothetical protein